MKRGCCVLARTRIRRAGCPGSTAGRMPAATIEPTTSGCTTAFTLVELLVVIGILALLGCLVLPTLNKAKAKSQNAICLNNLRQWGLAAHLHAAEHDDLLCDEGAPSPGLRSVTRGWYVSLPLMLGLPSYHAMPWRTNALLNPGSSLFICPSNSRRATNNNLFHYCLNEHIDGTGAEDRPTKVSSIGCPGQAVYLFDNGKRAAVAQYNNVHTNLHDRGAQFLFVDGHVARFRNVEYWDFVMDRGKTNNPALVWFP